MEKKAEKPVDTAPAAAPTEPAKAEEKAPARALDELSISAVGN